MSAKSVLVVDDDDNARKAVCAALTAQSYLVRSFSSAGALLKTPMPSQGCVLADLCMPEMDGLELLAEIRGRKIELPFVLMTGGGDIPLAVRAMKAGATDFIAKPFPVAALISTIEAAFQPHGDKSEKPVRKASALLDRLSLREKEVLAKIAGGLSNKEAARELSLSPRTVEFHRANILEKTGARNLLDLMRIHLEIAG